MGVPKPFPNIEYKDIVRNPAFVLFGSRFYADQTTIELLAEFLMVMFTNKWIGSDAVSYTHLDVYKRQRPHTAEEFEKVARCLMEGIRVLHENKNEDGNLEPIIHGDIKPDNIIITPTGNPVLIDLGLAGPHRIEHYHGTPPYIPPYAIISSEREFSVKCDLYALGVTLWEWLFGEKPYENPAVGDKPDIPKNAHGFEYVLPWLTGAIATEDVYKRQILNCLR